VQGVPSALSYSLPQTSHWAIFALLSQSIVIPCSQSNYPDVGWHKHHPRSRIGEIAGSWLSPLAVALELRGLDSPRIHRGGLACMTMTHVAVNVVVALALCVLAVTLSLLLVPDLSLVALLEALTSQPPCRMAGWLH